MMRTREEIERAHDLLLQLLLNAEEMDEQNKMIVSCHVDALCWVLCHDSNTTFAKSLANIEAVLAMVGIKG
jgi:hypothetical protein